MKKKYSKCLRVKSNESLLFRSTSRRKGPKDTFVAIEFTDGEFSNRYYGQIKYFMDMLGYGIEEKLAWVDWFTFHGQRGGNLITNNSFRRNASHFVKIQLITGKVIVCDKGPNVRFVIDSIYQ